MLILELMHQALNVFLRFSNVQSILEPYAFRVLPLEQLPATLWSDESELDLLAKVVRVLSD